MAAPPSPLPGTTGRQPSAGAYVLIAEPDQRRAALYRDILEPAGVETLVTRNGDEAKAMLKRRAVPVLVVANLSLPRLDGFALLAELRRAAQLASPPVLVISSSKELSGAAWNLKERLGVTEILPADASEDQVREALARVLPGLVPQARPGEPASPSDRWIAETLDRYAQDAARRFAVVAAAASVVINDQEWFRVQLNIPPRPLSGRPSPREWSFLRQVLEGREPVVVPDAAQHPVFGRDAFPPAGTLRGYAGVPVVGQSGTLGALALFDSRPLTLDARAIDALSDAAHRLALELDSALERVEVQQRFSALSRLALTDPVTGLTNRRGGEEALAREVSRARRTGAPLSLVLFDIDHFKRINDQAGHAVGDRVLRGLSDILSGSQRGSDLAMRWGGEEFLVLLPDVGLAGARIYAERVRENVQGLAVPEAGRITVSGGVAELRADEDASTALARADANLYRAKAAGRNRVECEEDVTIGQPTWLRHEGSG